MHSNEIGIRVAGSNPLDETPNGWDLQQRRNKVGKLVVFMKETKRKNTKGSGRCWRWFRRRRRRRNIEIRDISSSHL
jgi:hypothetical protein